MNLQTLVTDELVATIENMKYTATVEHAASNVGYVFALDKNLDTCAVIGFDFQTKYFSLKFYDDMTATQPGSRLSTGTGRNTNSDLLTAAHEYLQGRLQ